MIVKMVTIEDILKCQKCGHIRDERKTRCYGEYINGERNPHCSGGTLIIRKGDNLKDLGIEVGSLLYPDAEYELFCSKDCKERVERARWAGFDASDW